MLSFTIPLLDKTFCASLNRTRKRAAPHSTRLGVYAWSVLFFFYNQSDRTTQWPLSSLYTDLKGRSKKRTRKALARATTRLTELGFVRKSAYQEDRRTHLITLTKSGEQFVATLLPPRR